MVNKVSNFSFNWDESKFASPKKNTPVEAAVSNVFERESKSFIASSSLAERAHIILDDSLEQTTTIKALAKNTLLSSFPSDKVISSDQVSVVGAAAIRSLNDNKEEFIASKCGLTTHEWQNFQTYVRDFRNQLKGNKIKVNFEQPVIIEAKKESGLARSVLFIEINGDIKVYALLKQKGGITALGSGEFKKATWALDIETGERKVFLTEKREKRFGVIRPINDSEKAALTKYAGNPRFNAGKVVSYTFKKRNESEKPISKRGVLLDFMEGGELMDYLDSTDPNSSLNIKQNLIIARDVAQALAFMHANQDMHLDVKPANIMLRVQKGQLRASLGDFSLVAKVGSLRLKGGTNGYMAPEMIKAAYLQDLKKVTTKSDVWSLGKMLYDLKMGHYHQASVEIDNRHFLPKGGDEGLAAWKETHLPDRNSRGSLDWAIDHCLHINPSMRITMPELIQAIDAYLIDHGEQIPSL